MYIPGDDSFDAGTKRLEDQLQRLDNEHRELITRLGVLKPDLEKVTADYDRLSRLLAEKQRRESRQARLRQLLHRNWKSLRSVPFEEFLEEVFVELGYGVETTKVTGDQGADLILIKDCHRIAVQVKGYFNSVGNSAVQEAHAAKDYYRCEACAVITNSRFTSGAQDLAAGVGCLLIDEERLPALVLGQLDLWQLHLARQRQQM